MNLFSIFKINLDTFCQSLINDHFLSFLQNIKVKSDLNYLAEKYH